MYYVVDTHPLFWSLFDDQKLSPIVQDIFEQTSLGQNTIYIPAIVVTEIMLIVEHRCTTTRFSEFIETLRAMQLAGNYLFLPLMPETVVASYTFNDQISDIFDRLVVAEARRLHTSLITCDPTISASGLVDVVWE